MSMEGELIEGLKELFRRFLFVSLRHQPRLCNFVAYQLVKFSLSCNEYMLLDGDSYFQDDLCSLHYIDK